MHLHLFYFHNICSKATFFFFILSIRWTRWHRTLVIEFTCFYHKPTKLYEFYVCQYRGCNRFNLVAWHVRTCYILVTFSEWRGVNNCDNLMKGCNNVNKLIGIILVFCNVYLLNKIFRKGVYTWNIERVFPWRDIALTK